MANTYNFKDISFVISHPSVGQIQVTGQGIGDVTVSYSDNNTESDIGNDGVVMPTKVNSSRGTISLQIQQTSSLNNWLLNYFNTVYNGSTSLWSSASVTITELFTNGQKTVATGVSPLKRPDHSDQQQGQKKTWELFGADIQESAA